MRQEVMEREDKWGRERDQLKEEIKDLKKKIESMDVGRGEDLLNTSEVHKVKRMLSEKEREERRNNIVIKGIDKIEDIKDAKEWTEKLLREELVKGKVIQCRRSKVPIVKLGKDEEKKEIMLKKNKLKGSKIYI